MSHWRALTVVFAVLCLCGDVAARAQGFDPLERTINDVLAATRAGTPCRAIVDAYLRRIDAYNHRGPALNAVQTVNPNARRQAEALDAAAPAGARGPLHCVPVLVKDQLDTSEMPTTFGSRVFRDFVPGRTATVVERLQAAGAIVIGKAAMGEFALGYAGSLSGPIRNPYDPSRHASGSSGGTAAGVAASLAVVGIGEDTGGSIRGPAAVTGLVGLRPTLPLVSRHGAMPSRPSADTLGPIARTARDAALIMDVIAGYDPRDPVTAYAVGHIPTSFAAGFGGPALKSVRIGVISRPLSSTTDREADDFRMIRGVIEKALASMRGLGAEVVMDIEVPESVVVSAGSAEGNVFETEAAIDHYLVQHANAPVRTLRAILLTGAVIPFRARGLMNNVGRSVDEPGYQRLLQSAETARRTVLGLMAGRQLDVLAYASSDHAPTLIAADVMTNPNEGDTRKGSNRALASVLAFPAIVIPVGTTPDGLPVGLELLGRPYDDAALLRYADAVSTSVPARGAPRMTPALPD